VRLSFIGTAELVSRMGASGKFLFASVVLGKFCERLGWSSLTQFGTAPVFVANRHLVPMEFPMELGRRKDAWTVKLPNGEKAMVEIAKLRDYCLSVAHPEGRHKARVFRAGLGIGPADSRMVQERLLAAARDQDAVVGEVDEFGPQGLTQGQWNTPARAIFRKILSPADFNDNSIAALDQAASWAG
jgi:hypothetical protein